LDTIPLPKTVEDAMYMVKHVGERYLWVDALCITQYDPTELGATLQLMRLIYGNAVFTICAMDGEDAESGLARLRPHTDKAFEPTAILGNSTIVSGDSYEFSRMKWATRAWTY
jgi:hypothetical protein